MQRTVSAMAVLPETHRENKTHKPGKQTQNKETKPAPEKRKVRQGGAGSSFHQGQGREETRGPRQRVRRGKRGVGRREEEQRIKKD